MNTSYWGKVVNGQVRRGGRSLRDGPVRLPPRHARPAGHSPRLGANFDERARRHELLGLRIRRRNTVDQHRAPRAGAAAEIRRRTAPCNRRGSRSGTARACGRESRWSGRGRRGTRFDDWRREVFDDPRTQHARRERGRREPILRGARARSARRENDIAEWLAGEVLTPHLDAPDVRRALRHDAVEHRLTERARDDVRQEVADDRLGAARGPRDARRGTSGVGGSMKRSYAS